jgi:RNA polymerase sigma-70 factor (ECF subfamily)
VEDDDIRAALRRGHDDVAFRLLTQAHGRAVYTTCCRILRNPTAAEDAMQQAMIAAFTHRSRLLGVEQIRGWLIQIASRKCLDALRSAKRSDRLQRDLVDSDAPDEVRLLEQLGTTQDRRALEECLATLAPDIAAAVQMRYRDRMSWAQIAEAVGMPLDTIRMRVQRGALKSLRDCLEAKEVTL